MPNGVDAETSRPGPDTAGLRAGSGSRRTRRRGVRRDARPRPPLQAARRRDRGAGADLATSAPALVAGGGELLDGVPQPSAARPASPTASISSARVPHAELPDVLRAADLFLLTTEPPESFGIVLIEAMACGLPVAGDRLPRRARGRRRWRERAARRRRRLRRGRRRARPAGRRRRRRSASASGRRAGRRREREWSWPRLLDRMDDAYPGRSRRGGSEADERAAPADPARRLLLPAEPRHRRAPARVDGASTCAGSGTTSRSSPPPPTGAPDDDGPQRRPDRRHRPRLPTWRARRMRGHGQVDSLFDSRHLLGQAAPARKVIVPEPLAVAWAPFAPAAAAACTASAASIASSRPRRRSRPTWSAGRSSAPAPAWVADLRDAWTFEPLRPLSRPSSSAVLDERMERRCSRARTRSSASAGPSSTTCATAGSPRGSSSPNGWDADATPLGRGRPCQPVAELLDPDRVSLVYTGRFGSYGRDPRPLLEASARWPRPTPRQPVAWSS